MFPVRTVMEAVAALHGRGFGRLKIWCLAREVGRWDYTLFAADEFPLIAQRDKVPRPYHAGSTYIHDDVPPSAAAVQEYCDELERRAPALLEAARGRDEVYRVWYRHMLASAENALLEMESPYRVALDYEPYEVRLEYAGSSDQVLRAEGASGPLSRDEAITAARAHVYTAGWPARVVPDQARFMTSPDELPVYAAPPQYWAIPLRRGPARVGYAEYVIVSELYAPRTVRVGE